jgi:hypothetical protein
MSNKFKIRAGIALGSIVIGSALIGLASEEMRVAVFSAGIGLLLFGVAAMFGLAGD